MSYHPCSRRNSPQCEQCILNLASRNIIPMDKDSTPILIQLKQIFEQLGVLLVTSEGKIQFLAQQGEQLLRQYFSADSLQSLPEPLQRWFKHQIAFFMSEDKTFSPCLGLHIQQGVKQLRISLMCNFMGNSYLLLLNKNLSINFKLGYSYEVYLPRNIQ